MLSFILMFHWILHQRLLRGIKKMALIDIPTIFCYVKNKLYISVMVHLGNKSDIMWNEGL